MIFILSLWSAVSLRAPVQSFVLGGQLNSPSSHPLSHPFLPYCCYLITVNPFRLKSYFNSIHIQWHQSRCTLYTWRSS
ncbi:hypothetical protein BKA69DRAFT_1049809 [Paraphysoderma sedebokerense]|nr:hypothetical protein BKA69DRAFT_1049809 [Paraphysoderma sedebokerense]